MVDKRIKSKGRSESGAIAHFVMLEHWLMDMAAWRDLDPVARCAYIEVKRFYNGINNGRIFVGVRDLAEKLGVSKNTAARALASLQSHGFLVVMEKGSFTRKIRHSTQYRITEAGCDVNNTLATKDFARWKKNTVPVVGLSVPQVGPIGTCGGTTTLSNTPKNPPHGISNGTVPASLGPTTGTHIGLPSPASKPCASASASELLSASSGKGPKSGAPGRLHGSR